MKKLQVVISPEDWGTLVTKYAPSSKKVKLGDFTDGTKNIDTDVNGNITKREGGPDYNPVALAGAVKDQYEAIFSDGARHMIVVTGGEFKYSSGDGTFNTVQNGSGFTAGANFEFTSTQNRVYGGNGADSPIVYDRTTGYGGVTYTAPRIKTMGCQAPSGAPTATIAAGGSVPAGAHTYKVTFVYYGSQESNGGTASAVVTAGGADFTGALTDVPIGGYGVTARKIYRDNNDGVYTHVGTIDDNTTTTFNDTLLVGATPTPIPEDNDVPPSFSLIAQWLGKSWIAGLPGDPFILRHSDTDMPDIFPSDLEVVCNEKDTITGLIVYYGRLMVFNRKSFGQILGRTNDTFRYDEVPSSVGCVDNRTIQIRVIKGVPILVWLSDGGFYSYDGNSIDYLSDDIEDLVNFNIQQATQQKGQNTQSSEAQFLDGTASQGIDLSSVSGQITVKGYLDGTSTVGNNPRRNFDDQNDWDSGLTKETIKYLDGTNAMRMPLFNAFNPALGQHSGTVTTSPGDGTHIELPTATLLGGESNTVAANNNATPFTGLAMKFIPSVSGTVATGSISNYTSGSYAVYSHDSVNDRPDSSLGAVGSVTVVSGTTYWLVLEHTNTGYHQANNFGFSSATGTNRASRRSGGSWFGAGGTAVGYGSSYYTITTAPTALAGQWTSTIYDSGASNPSTLQIFLKGVYPSGTTGSLTVEGSNSALFASVAVSQVEADPNGTIAISLSGARYWRLKLSLTTANNLSTPSVGGTVTTNTGSFVLEFARTATWISPAIDCSADVTTYNALTVAATNISGSVATTVTTTIATSADNVSYSAFGAFGAHVVERYVKIKIVMTAGQSSGSVPSYYLLTPIVTSIIFKWTVVSNLVSSIIDTAVAPPAGWDLFLASYTTNGGTVEFQMRSAAAAIDIPAAVFSTVTPSAFPVITPLQFVQWKVIITATDGAVPTVDSVTVQWFISLISSLRPASIFVDSCYFVALAELEQSTNTILVELDSNGKWRVHRGIKASTFGFFFNRPYLGVATEGKIRRFLGGTTDNGVAIEADIRFKAFDFSTQYQDNSDKIKIVADVLLRAKNTGAAYQLFYSVDEGVTFYPLLLNDGTTSYQSSTDGSTFHVRFRPDWNAGNPISGRTIMYRILNTDAFEMEVSGIKATALVREQDPVITG